MRFFIPVLIGLLIQQPSNLPETNTKGWNSQYTRFLRNNIDTNLRQLSPKCFEKRIEAIAYAESEFDPRMDYKENGLGLDRLTGNQIVSSGLMQVSYQDKLYYGCNFDWPDPKNTIHDPYINLDCALKIFRNLHEKNPTENFQQTGSRYWSTLRPRRSGFKKVQDYLADKAPSCKF